MLSAHDLPTAQILGNLLAPEPAGIPALAIAVVCDTNVLLDWFYWHNPAEHPLLEFFTLSEHVVCVRSAQTLLELADVIRRPQFCLSISQQEEILRSWSRISHSVTVSANSPIKTRDPNDQKFLDLAVSANARILLTKDKDLLRCARKAKSQHLTICPPIRLLNEKDRLLA